MTAKAGVARSSLASTGAGWFDYFVHIGQNGHMTHRISRTPTGSRAVARNRRTARGRVATFRNSRGEAVEAVSLPASQAKSEFGRVLEMAMQGGAVVITRHDAPKAVLISIENFNALSAATESRLDTLTREFDALLARMQTPAARRGMKTAFAASGRQLGLAAAAAPRRRG